MRIAGRDLKSNKMLVRALEDIRGIGQTRAKYIVQQLKLLPNKKIKDLVNSEIDAISNFIENNFVTEGALLKEQMMNIKHKIDIRCYEGLRHQKGLPVHGQGTRTNAKTSRKKRSA